MLGDMPHESRLSFSREELLANRPVKEPLIVSGVRCHGGFDEGGNYVSPRTLWRTPAIRAWQEHHLATSPIPLFEIPRDTLSPHMPNVAQAKFLLHEGVREPMVRTLTEIAIVEGFGAMIRELPVPPLKTFIREDTTDTLLAHLAGGLFVLPVGEPARRGLAVEEREAPALEEPAPVDRAQDRHPEPGLQQPRGRKRRGQIGLVKQRDARTIAA